ncbi:UvrD-helicase domain-containing protein [Cellulomonas marina]|uniref:RecBCD enzyme subunit RecB n=1 Tax=Cellulomonas marina TaxID=988821 RepID=A0A1I0ZA48_9CELL|nr:UvrD-helicase domain-containing protein [Cellulomonas marina]GIG28988.1 RecBCD enzyme subunit RecB [Cellulomonas marina]SFB22629.1 exodeoxyribonuclease V beta subunit [Cellulomonas marina]
MSGVAPEAASPVPPATGATTAVAPPVFDVCGPLPTGTVVLEASAGTGKTTTIASLAARYVAEGVATLPELLLVTFGRLATSELRERVRDRLLEVEAALRGSDARTSSDDVVRHLAAVDDDERHRRGERLADALSAFDAATITTTHGFCQEMLATLGTVGDVDRDATLLPDVAALEAEVVDDLYLRKYVGTSDPTLTVTLARSVAHEAVSDHGATVEPADADPGTRAGDAVRLALAARREMTRRKRGARVLDYDDLLVLLRDALADPATGPAAAERVRARYRVVMVDEFQDTDPVQWEILRTAFHGSRTLVLIGDPKQAIYAFRGADVVTYLRARAEASTSTLGRNWRADPDVLAGLAPLLRGTALGDPRIVVHPVEAGRTGRRLEGGPAVVVRQVTRAALGTTGVKDAAVGAVRALVHADVAAEVVRRLRTTTVVGADGTRRPLRPGDVAVLARRNADALSAQAALVEAGVPAVTSMLTSVFGTPAAQDWLVLLSALARPGVRGLTAAVALGPFVGWSATDLAGADGTARDRLDDRVRGWARLLADHGVAALVEATAAAGVRERLVALPDGERRLTDLRHVGEALHAAATGQGMGPSSLLEWLRERIAEAATDYAEERSRRLETDAAAVQVITVHAAKGLQFPVVLVPYLWDRWTPDNPETLTLHRDDARVLHVGGKGSPGYDEARAAAAEDESGEGLRLAYVAMTRAASQLVLWWAPSRNSGRAPLTRLLLGGRDADGRPADLVRAMTDDVATVRLREHVVAAGAALALELVAGPPEVERWEPPPVVRADLDVAVLDRVPDTGWRRTSYSALTAAAHDAAHPPGPGGAVGSRSGTGAGTAAGTGVDGGAGLVGRPGGAGVTSEPETSVVIDEPEDAPALPLDPFADLADATAAAAAGALPSPLADLPGGTGFGTLVHEVLETVDTAAADLDAELTTRCTEAGTAAAAGVTPEVLAAALLPVLRTPLGALADGRTLADVAPGDRLAELDFELPLAGGDVAVGGHGAVRTPARVGDLAALLRTHLPPDDPFAGYAERLEDRALAAGRLSGYLTGSIDAVLRVPVDDHEGGRSVPGGHRYLVVDYKTNRLGTAGESLTTWHYRPEAMVAAMLDAHYPLQLLLYSAALHRYLRWRLRGYDPEQHLGGGLYLFVRGMAGPATPVLGGAPCGVMAWRPPAALVVALSDLLDGRQP